MTDLFYAGNSDQGPAVLERFKAEMAAITGEELLVLWRKMREDNASHESNKVVTRHVCTNFDWYLFKNYFDVHRYVENFIRLQTAHLPIHYEFDIAAGKGELIK